MKVGHGRQHSAFLCLEVLCYTILVAKLKLRKVALLGAGSYFLILWTSDIVWFLIRKAYVLRIIGDPDGSITYFRFWLSYTPWAYIFESRANFFIIQITNSIIWALISVVIYLILNRVWSKIQKQ